MTAAIDFIGLEFGATRLRGWAMDRAGDVLTEDSRPEASEPALTALLRHLRTEGDGPLVACGGGWPALTDCTAFPKVPAEPPVGALLPLALPGSGDVVQMVPGLRQEAPAGLIHGGETRVAGFLYDRRGFDGVIVLAGEGATHWLQVSAGEAVSFRSALTGRLRACLEGIELEDEDPGEEFAGAVGAALSRPETLAAELAALEAEAALSGLGATEAQSRLEGLLIGAELGAMRPYWLGQRIAVIGAPRAARRYSRALEGQGMRPEVADEAATTRRGLWVARQSLGRLG